MSLLQFHPAARFEHDDVVRMRRLLDQLLVSGRGSWPLSACELVADARRWLGSSLAAGACVSVDTERLLDVAADLLDASHLLQFEGDLVGAFALEGVQGRLLEAAVGAGTIEPAPWPPPC